MLYHPQRKPFVIPRSEKTTLRGSLKALQGWNKSERNITFSSNRFTWERKLLTKRRKIEVIFRFDLPQNDLIVGGSILAQYIANLTEYALNSQNITTSWFSRLSKLSIPKLKYILYSSKFKFKHKLSK